MRGRGIWYRAWKRRAEKRSAANRFVVGELERPLPGQRFVHVLDVAGWAKGRGAGAGAGAAAAAGDAASAASAAVRVEVNGQVVAESDTASTGGRFQFLIPNSQLPSGGLLWLTVKAAAAPASASASASAARDGAANGWETLHVIPIRRGKGWLTPPPRDAYGRVWDQSSTNLRHARLSVAGHDDDAEWRRTGEASAEYMVRANAIAATDTVLEIGCGAARVGVQLAPRCGRWIGADVSRNMLGHAREALRAAGVTNVDFVHLNGYDLEGIANASIDVVYCTAVFMHLEEWDRYRYVREAFRVLRPGGRVYFDNFNLLTAEGWALFDETARLDVAIRPPNVSKSSTPQELRCYAERAGFEGIEVDEGGLWVAVRARKPASA